MNKICILLCALAILSANARTADTEESLESRLSAGLTKAAAASSKNAKPNTIVKGKRTYSGLAVEIAKTGNPLQLLNPAAPPEYGSVEDNVLRDPISGEVSGWKIFSIHF